jgi:hypothetical protein
VPVSHTSSSRGEIFFDRPKAFLGPSCTRSFAFEDLWTVSVLKTFEAFEVTLEYGTVLGGKERHTLFPSAGCTDYG